MDETRIVRDENGNSYTVEDMTYAEWKEKFVDGVDFSGESGIIRDGELFRKKSKSEKERESLKFISDEQFDRLTIQARKNGANILRGGDELTRHLDKQGAAASIVGDTILFRDDVCVSEVLEETYHFMQNQRGLNNDKPDKLRSILNEIDAKEYLLNVEKKYKIPRNETETTRQQLEIYKHRLEEYGKGEN